MECGGTWPQRRRPFNELDGPTRVTALVVHDAEEVKGLGILRFAGQQPMVAAGRIGVAAGLVELKSGRQEAIHGDGPLPGPGDTVSPTGRARH